jgi:hypothetical protein
MVIASLILVFNKHVRFVVRESLFPTIFTDYKRSSVEDFEAYKKDYDKIKDVCMKYYESMKIREDNSYMINTDDLGDRYMYDIERKKKISLSKSEQGSLNRVYESFGYDYLKMIYFDENRITFRGEDDFAIVYSFDDKKPKFFIKSDKPEDNYNYIRKLDDHWYSIANTTI